MGDRAKDWRVDAKRTGNGKKRTEMTEVALLRDADYLYIGVIYYDSEPDEIISTRMARDASLGSKARLEIVLDTHRDQRNAF
jgi:hypothetical protein